jgi:hypothetical protein
VIAELLAIAVCIGPMLRIPVDKTPKSVSFISTGGGLGSYTAAHIHYRASEISTAASHALAAIA